MIGYGVALNSDILPWDVLSMDFFKNNANNVGTNNDQQLPVSDLNTKNQELSNNQNAQSQELSDQNTQISESEAQSIANKYIKEPTASSGSPQMTEIAGKDTYVVPVESNKDRVGEIYIDPETGDNMGGAGGAPNKIY